MTRVTRLTAVIGRALPLGIRSDLIIAIGDQGLLSIFNFALNLYLIRMLEAEAYGAFALWLSVTLFCVSLQNAIVTTPLSVYVPGHRDRQTAARLERSIATVNWGFVAIAVAAVAVAGSALGRTWIPSNMLLVGILAYVGGTLLREFARGLAFAHARLVELIRIDGVFLTLAVLGLAVGFAADIATGDLLTVAFLAMAVGAVAGGIGGIWRFGRGGAGFWQRDWHGAYRAMQKEVGWSLAGAAATHGQARSYIYVVSALAGPESLAVVFALSILFQPIRLIGEAWSRVARPRMARKLAEGNGAAFHIAGQGAAMLVLGHLLLTAALFVLWPWIDAVVFGGRYEGVGMLLLPWAIATLIYLLRVAAAVLLQAAREFRAIFQAIAVSATITLAATATLTLWLGYAYCLYGLAIGELSCLLLLLRAAMLRAAGTATSWRPQARDRMSPL